MDVTINLPDYRKLCFQNTSGYLNRQILTSDLSVWCHLRETGHFKDDLEFQNQ